MSTQHTNKTFVFQEVTMLSKRTDNPELKQADLSLYYLPPCSWQYITYVEKREK